MEEQERKEKHSSPFLSRSHFLPFFPSTSLFPRFWPMELRRNSASIKMILARISATYLQFMQIARLGTAT